MLHSNCEKSTPKKRRPGVPQSNVTSIGEKGGRARVSRPPRVVRNLDFLKVNFWIEWEDSRFLQEVEGLKIFAQAQDVDSVPYHCPGGFDWNVSRTGTKSYNFVLSSGDITLLFNRRRANGVVPTMRMEIGSVSCWTPGYFHLYERILRWIQLLGGQVVKETVSEIHLAADFIGVDINDIDIVNDEKWIRRGHKFKMHKHRRNLEGISIGKDNLMLRIYDKVFELKNKSPHKQPVFAEVWSVKSYDDEPVTRVEYQIKREILMQFQEKINTVKDLLFSLQSVWKYCTNDWSRFCKTIVNRNHNQTHAANAEFWMMVTEVVWSGVSDIVRSGKKSHKDVESLRKQLRGLAMTISLFFDVHPTDLDHIIGIAQKVIGDDLKQFYKDDEFSFIERMKKKRNEIFIGV